MSEKTKDHVFPKSWYPDNTSDKIQRWTVPSCNRCNNRLGKIEQELFIKIALCVDNKKIEASGIARRAISAYKNNLANEKEILIKKSLLDNLKRDMIAYDKKMKAFPGFGPHVDPAVVKQYAINIPHNNLIEVAKKIIRGCEYKLEKRLVENQYSINISFPDKKVPSVDALFLKKTSRGWHHGPGFKLQRIASVEDRNIVLYKVIIWGTLEFYSVIDLKKT